MIDVITYFSGLPPVSFQSGMLMFFSVVGVAVALALDWVWSH